MFNNLRRSLVSNVCIGIARVIWIQTQTPPARQHIICIIAFREKARNQWPNRMAKPKMHRTWTPNARDGAYDTRETHFINYGLYARIFVHNSGRWNSSVVPVNPPAITKCMRGEQYITLYEGLLRNDVMVWCYNNNNNIIDGAAALMRCEWNAIRSDVRIFWYGFHGNPSCVPYEVHVYVVLFFLGSLMHAKTTCMI